MLLESVTIGRVDRSAGCIQGSTVRSMRPTVHCNLADLLLQAGLTMLVWMFLWLCLQWWSSRRWIASLQLEAGLPPAAAAAARKDYSRNTRGIVHNKLPMQQSNLAGRQMRLWLQLGS